MWLCIDVQYEDQAATTAGIGFAQWTEAAPAFELVLRSEGAPAAYEPGQFYKRELPYLLEMIRQAEARSPIKGVIVDGHVWLGSKPGLGAHLYEGLGRRVPVIGVAKSAFHEGGAIEIHRGQSRHPLFVTAAGIDPTQAARFIVSMHGPHRLPTLLKRVDSLARGH